MKIIDLQGLKCPMPLIQTKKALNEASVDEVLELIIDNDTSFKNVKRYLEDNNIHLKHTQDGAIYKLIISKTQQDLDLKETDPYCDIPTKKGDSYVVLMAKDTVGEGIPELGYALANALLSTLPNLEILPEKIIFMNSGINLVIKGSHALRELKTLQNKGVELLVCGSCLDYMDKMDDLVIGEISNMLEITESMLKVDKVLNF